MTGRPPKTANQLRLFAKAVERKAVKTYMARADEYDITNRRNAEFMLAKHARGEEVAPYWLAFALACKERLGF